LYLEITPPQQVKRWVELLPPDMRKELSDEVAHHIFTKAADLAASPTKGLLRSFALEEVKGGKVKAIRIEADKLITELYGSKKRRQILQTVLEPGMMEKLDDWASIFKLLRRRQEIAGSVGAFGAETSQPIGFTAQLKAIKSRIILSDPIQAFVSGGAHNPEGFSQVMAALGKFNQQALPRAGMLAKETLAAQGVPESTLRLLNLYLKASEDVPEFRELMEPNAAGSREGNLEEWKQLLREQEQKEEE